MIIDPVILIYSTYLGGSNNEYAANITVDKDSNTYITGATSSADFPTQDSYHGSNGGGCDVFITKLKPGKPVTLGYSTYLGGFDYDSGYDIVVDDSGNVYLTGGTYSVDFPTLDAYQYELGGDSDIFIAKLDPAGDLLFSTFLGGLNQDSGMSITFDSYDDIYVTGITHSTDFTTKLAFQGTFKSVNSLYPDGFITKINSDGKNLIYSTYIGASRRDYCYNIAVDNSGNVFVSGMTLSDDFPTKNAYQKEYRGGGSLAGDAFLLKMNSSGSDLVYSTFFGGSMD